MNENLEFVQKRVYFAARDGFAKSLYTILSELKPEQQQIVLNQVVEEQGQSCTPLIVAARNSHEDVVKMLISKFNVSLEQEGNVKFEDNIVEGASPLWCAAGAGHLKIVKVLVKAGANLNHLTRTNSTPLRAACFDGRLDIVKYLVEHKADIRIANKYNNTCLMITAYKGHKEIISYLISQGADLNQTALCGATALHFASECGHLEIVQELVENQAQITKNNQGMTPLLCAAERTKADIVEYFTSLPNCTPEERIEALELLGGSFANDKENYNLELAYGYLHRAMKERYKDHQNPILKPLCTPVAAYDYWQETKSLSELEAIRHNSNALHMEGLAIRERVLGTSNPELPHSIIFRGAVFADSARFDRCIDLWLHALRLRFKMLLSVVKDLLRFAQVFSQVIHVGVELDFGVVEEVFSMAVTELERNKQKIANPGPKDDPEAITEEMECNLTTILYLLVIITKVRSKATAEQEFNVHRNLFRLSRLNVRNREGSSLLHLAVNVDTPVDNFHISDICRFPCAATCKLLLQCGFDANAMDNDRNTALHLIVSYPKPISDFMTLHSIIMALVEAGAHMDAVNCSGETPFESATTGVAEIILRTQSKICLKCIAAKAVKKYALSYKGQVPKPLEGFIELHGSGTVQR